MQNYFTGIVIITDIVFFAVSICLFLLITVYSAGLEIAWRRRGRALLKIKRNVYELVLSGGNSGATGAGPPPLDVTPSQFLDVVTNRNRDVVFFNEAEQKLIIGDFSSKADIKKVEETALHSRSKWTRIEALMALGYARVKSAPAALAKGINSTDEDVSYYSIIALGQIKDIESGRELLAFLAKKNFHRYKIVSLLESFPKELADDAASLLGNKDPDIQFWALRLISKYGSSSYTAKVEDLASGRSDKVRAAACDCLGETAGHESRGVLVKCLEDDYWLVRSNAAIALSRILKDKCLPDVARLMNDGSISVINTLKNILIEYIDSSFPYIDKYLRSEDAMARKIAIEVLETSGRLKKVFMDALAGDDEALKTLDALVKANAFSGIKAAMDGLDDRSKERIIGVIKNTDEAMAGKLSGKT